MKSDAKPFGVLSTLFPGLPPNLYENGNGVLKNHVLAYLWYSIAAKNGGATAEKNKEAIERKMTKAELKQAKELMGLCLNSTYKNCGF